jgi:hypothetical protein
VRGWQRGQSRRRWKRWRWSDGLLWHQCHTVFLRYDRCSKPSGVYGTEYFLFCVLLGTNGGPGGDGGHGGSGGDGGDAGDSADINIYLRDADCDLLSLVGELHNQSMPGGQAGAGGAGGRGGAGGPGTFFFCLMLLLCIDYYLSLPVLLHRRSWLHLDNRWTKWHYSNELQPGRISRCVWHQRFQRVERFGRA